jgi:two-component system response regulator FixJ
MIQKHHIYFVEDDPALRRTVRRMLADLDASFEEFESAEAFLEDYSSRPAACVLLDLKLPGMSGLELLENISGKAPSDVVIMLSGHGDIPSAVRAVKVGALDFLQKPFTKQQLVVVVERAFNAIDADSERFSDFETLTNREREVLRAFSTGAPNKIVAYDLGLSPRTVEMHRARIFRKLGVTNLAQALLRAKDAGLDISH